MSQFIFVLIIIVIILGCTNSGSTPQKTENNLIGEAKKIITADNKLQNSWLIATVDLSNEEVKVKSVSLIRYDKQQKADFDRILAKAPTTLSTPTHRLALRQNKELGMVDFSNQEIIIGEEFDLAGKPVSLEYSQRTKKEGTIRIPLGGNIDTRKPLEIIGTNLKTKNKKTTILDSIKLKKLTEKIGEIKIDSQNSEDNTESESPNRSRAAGLLIKNLKALTDQGFAPVF